MRVAVAVDLGATKIAFALVSESGQVLERARVATQSDDGGARVAERVAEESARLIDRARGQGLEVAGVGIGSAGVISPEGTVLNAANAMKDWSGTPLGAIVAERTGVRCGVVNDCHAHAMGEGWLGSTAHAETSLLVAVGTGVGGGYVQNGKVLQGACGVAGHVGHFSSLFAAGLDCPCGGVEHVEAVAAGPGIVRAFHRAGGSSQVADVQGVAECAAGGDTAAIQAIELGARALGVALADLANILNPHAIVLAGGVVNLGERWLSTVREEFIARALAECRSTPITLAALGQDAPLFGAARWILRPDDSSLDPR